MYFAHQLQICQMIDDDLGHLHHFIFSPSSSSQQSHNTIFCQNIIVIVCFDVPNIFKLLLICSFIIPITIFTSSFYTLMQIMGNMPFFLCFKLKTILYQPFSLIADGIFEEHRVIGSVLRQITRLAFTLASTYQSILFIYHYQSPRFYFFIQLMRT